MPGQAPWTGWTGHCRRPGRTGCHRTRLPRTENPRARVSSDGRRWIAADTRPGRVSAGLLGALGAPGGLGGRRTRWSGHWSLWADDREGTLNPRVQGSSPWGRTRALMLVRGQFRAPFRPVDQGKIRDLVAYLFRCSGFAIHPPSCTARTGRFSTHTVDGTFPLGLPLRSPPRFVQTLSHGRSRAPRCG